MVVGDSCVVHLKDGLLYESRGVWNTVPESYACGLVSVVSHALRSQAGGC